MEDRNDKPWFIMKLGYILLFILLALNLFFMYNNYDIAIQCRESNLKLKEISNESNLLLVSAYAYYRSSYKLLDILIKSNTASTEQLTSALKYIGEAVRQGQLLNNTLPTAEMQSLYDIIDINAEVMAEQSANDPKPYSNP